MKPFTWPGLEELRRLAGLPPIDDCTDLPYTGTMTERRAAEERDIILQNIKKIREKNNG